MFNSPGTVLQFPGAFTDVVAIDLTARGSRAVIALNGAGTVLAIGGKAALRCLGTQTFAYFDKRSITATKVETLTAG